eukprot:CAMPEP_0116844124 /NCGR_PEP_ID=MMETSP0418-20121206/12489_1 /TAXON_ID=1158023 /ORGANISM="Astrosyne radiata, Strain 13vi08-1A" /LENGTH=361 /DNA_ID=CAMNT_0004474993 /DNA_START=29 /DNA_END=1114 /DNA_ORIENTATION=+
MRFTRNNTQNDIKKFALFDIDEVELGKKLGCGGFSNVYQVKSFQPNNLRNRRIKRSHQEAREHLEQSNNGQYAIKFLKAEMLDNMERFDAAAIDLETEATILSRLDHENILKLRGWAANGPKAYGNMKRHDGYFLLMDRLEKTLSTRIEEWKSLIDPTEDNQEMRKNMLLEQLKLALDIASALEYLHDKGYIFRDLKPDNIGMDSRSRGKLFDFGLARAMPKGNMDKTFEMSGKIGTARYMAPEVYKHMAYNTKADVYSFAHVLWEMLSLTKPYEHYSKTMHRKETVQKGVRPDLDPTWSSGIQKLLTKSWHCEIAERPTMKEVRTTLEIEIAELQEQRRTPEKQNARRLSRQTSLASAAA